MAYLSITTDNPNFSFMIKKNPANPMMIKGVRKGQAFGFYSKNDLNTFNIFFKDAPNDVSYTKGADDSFEYINTTRYNSAMFVMNAVSEFFHSNFKKFVEFDEPNKFTYKATIGMIQVAQARMLYNFNRYFDDFTLEFEELANKNYKVIITTQKTFCELINYIYVFGVFLATTNSDYMYVDDGLTEKSIGAINMIDAPYYIRYQCKNFLISNQKTFNKYKEKLEKSNKYEINMVSGDTWNNRADKIKPFFSLENNIVEIGCGEGRYVNALAKKLTDSIYYAIDINEELLTAIDGKCRAREIDNVVTYNSLEAFLQSEKPEGTYDFLMTEVIEHMTKKEAKKSIQKVLNADGFNSLVVTTPNFQFNQFYLLDGFRHEEHQFEFTQAEFEEWIKDFDGIDIEFFTIGDTVNNIPTTLGAYIRKKQ